MRAKLLCEMGRSGALKNPYGLKYITHSQRKNIGPLLYMHIHIVTTNNVVIASVENSTYLMLEGASIQSYRNTDDSTETSFPYHIKQLVGSCSLT